jgi:hypothetical protein
MSYTLKSSGIATNLTLCIAVDSDGTTIKEFVSNLTLTIDSGVTRGSGTWKGNSRGYFTTNSSVTPISVVTGPTMSFTAPGVGLFCACSGMTVGTGAGGYMYSIYDGTGDDRGLGRASASSSGTWIFSGATKQAGGTALPTNGTTKFSYGGNYVAGGQKTIYYGLESGSLASDGTATDSDFPGQFIPNSFGGKTGLGNAPGNYHVMACFNKALSLAEMQSLHGDGSNDWFSTLFNAPAGGFFRPGGLSGLGSGGPFFQNPLQ